MDKCTMSYLFLSQDMKQNVSLSSYLDSWWHKISDLSWINLLSHGWQWEKEGKTEMNISTTKNLFNEIKNIVHNFWKGYHLVKNKKIADTSFKEKIRKVQADIKL